MNSKASDILLIIDTSTPILQLGISCNEAFWSLVEEGNNTHASLLAPKIQELYSKTPYKIKETTAVIVNLGPGSFTGLRIALSTAKGLGESLGIPVIGVNGLDTMGAVLREKNEPVWVLIDARKNRCYMRSYLQGSAITEVLDRSHTELVEEFSNQKILVAGPEVDKILPVSEMPDSWSSLKLTDWLKGLLYLGQQALTRGEKMGPGEGPYYHRDKEEDLGISPKKEDSGAVSAPEPQLGSAG